MEAQAVTFNLIQVGSIVFSVASIVGVYWNLKIKFEQMKTAYEKDIAQMKEEHLSIKAGKTAIRKEVEKEIDVIHKRLDVHKKDLDKHKEKTDDQFKEINEKLNIIIGKLEK